ncbi:hypothetical protein PULV_a2997 [Pseudoalteromonas ulvae UL12]|uniref:tryptophan halogenase family protein n=1 Tax=Pseudoalteromonas ulvae TaxID=107327 RepID=UPI00186B69A8|nr:tryptophan halogenase family protein [Pseudoalteromonas ulvae]MBE0362377.1 hypothetical protein [Pseudoalteromonas ulvae UL12]
MAIKAILDSIVIVGGGTAGWLTAANLAKSLNCDKNDAIKITLIESPNIPTIGVGEGTWPTMRKTLAKIGIDESEFIKQCGASFKQATKFVNWKSNPLNGENNHYYHLFSSIYDPTDFNLSPYWKLGYAGDESLTYANAVSPQALCCELGLAPKQITTKAYDGLQSYAYHLDAGKFSEMLKKHCTENLNVHFIADDVTEVCLDETGSISGVNTQNSGLIEGDFFVDCTGFSSLLLGKALNIGFKSVADTLLTDYAVTVQVPYDDPNADISSCTISTAQEAGWIWDIGLANRRGIGHVYSSKFMSHEDAERILLEYAGPQAKGLMTRKIKMEVGYREKFWHKNCVAIGLSAAFVEPLEASAIFLIEAASNMLAEQFPRQRVGMEYAERKFNESFKFRWDKTIDFIKLHYVLSKRDDPFWRANKDEMTIPDSLKAQLAHWSVQPVSNYDFANVYEPFPLESYQFVLNGMGFEQNLEPSRALFPMVDKATMSFDKVKKITEFAVKDLPTNRALLNKVHQHGFSKI